MKKFNFLLILFLLCIFINAESEYKIPVPFNTAEACLEAFWDPEISEFGAWNVENGIDYGLKIFQNWAAVDFSWMKKPVKKYALSMSKPVKADVTGYDTFVLSMNSPENCILHIILLTDKGTINKEFKTAGKDAEFAIKLNDASVIDKITINIETFSDLQQAGWINWIILQDSQKIDSHLSQWENIKPDWDKYIKDNTFEPLFKPVYNIFITELRLKQFRDMHNNLVNNNEESPFLRMKKSAAKYDPEAAIKQFAKGDIHILKKTKKFSNKGLRAAISGIVLKDSSLLRIACKHALSLAFCEYWDHGFTTQYPLSSFELRGFRRSYAANDIAWILDLAGEFLTPAGKNILLRRLAEEGIGPLNYTTWKYDYIFTSNQLAFFNTGRMSAYLVLEKEFPRVKSYTDIAYNESVENLKKMILNDGASYEGPGYFGSLVRRNCMAIQQYADARGYDLNKIVPINIKNTGNYAAAIISTTKHDHIAICDSDSDNIGLDSIVLMASLLPGSYWVNMLMKKVETNDAFLKDPYDMFLLRNIKFIKKKLPVFIFLPDTGYIASHRELEGEIVKIFIMGNKAHAEHCHEDKGSFILEFAGDSFAADIGIGSYSDPLHKLYKQCQRHNMLVPAGTEDRAHPENPLSIDLKPTGRGSSKVFFAKINAGQAFSEFYNKWVRTWKSNSPGNLIIEDDYELKKGTGVNFLWQTLLPCEILGNTVIITGKKGKISIKAPDDCGVKVEKLPMQDNGLMNCIVITKNAKKGKLIVSVKLEFIK